MPCRDLVLVDHLAATIRQAGSAVVFLGAGASESAGIPLAGRTIDLLTRQYHVRARTYSEAMESAFPGPNGVEKRREFTERLCAARLPSPGHLAVAHLAERGYVSALITTNFDRLTEIALTTVCTKPVLLYLWDDDVEDLPRLHQATVIFKLHGDYLWEDIAALSSEMRRRLSRKMRALVHKCLRDVPLVVVGYSGGDQSVMSSLSSAATTPDLLMRGVWWVAPCEGPTTGPLRQFVTSAREHCKDFHPVHLKSDQFFAHLCQALGVESPRHAWHLNHSLRLPWLRRRAAPLLLCESERAAGVVQDICARGANVGRSWVTGPRGSGKTGLASELCHRYFPTRCLYYSPRFGRNAPLIEDWRQQLALFCEEHLQRVDSATRWDTLVGLFAAGGVVIVDDFESTLADTWPELVGDVTLLLSAQRHAGSGANSGANSGDTIPNS